MTFEIRALTALEVLDSRSRPTLQVRCELRSGAVGSAGVPSGASTGTREAVERRDGDPNRFGGAGVMAAAAAVDGEIAEALLGLRLDALAELDHRLVELDGTPRKSRLGANTVVGVSMAAARALANQDGVSLYRWLATEVEPKLPVPHFNVINGGVHAVNELAFQEFMVAPVGAPSLAEAVRAGVEIYHALRARLIESELSVGLGDEGGFAPELRSPHDALELLVAAITTAGYEPSRDGVAIALDPAASEFWSDGRYTLPDGERTSQQLVDLLEDLTDRYPIWSIEDGLAEQDLEGWRDLTNRLGDRIQLVGDDVFVTDPELISAGIAQGIGNAALIKPNQIGTVTETLDALGVCRTGGFGAMVSHRSGETCDPFIADLAAASAVGQLKSGAPARGERVAKYNRLLEIARDEPGLGYGV